MKKPTRFELTIDLIAEHIPSSFDDRYPRKKRIARLLILQNMILSNRTHFTKTSYWTSRNNNYCFYAPVFNTNYGDT